MNCRCTASCTAPAPAPCGATLSSVACRAVLLPAVRFANKPGRAGIGRLQGVLRREKTGIGNCLAGRRLRAGRRRGRIDRLGEPARQRPGITAHPQQSFACAFLGGGRAGQVAGQLGDQAPRRRNAVTSKRVCAPRPEPGGNADTGLHQGRSPHLLGGFRTPAASLRRSPAEYPGPRTGIDLQPSLRQGRLPQPLPHTPCHGRNHRGGALDDRRSEFLDRGFCLRRPAAFTASSAYSWRCFESGRICLSCLPVMSSDISVGRTAL